MKSEFQSSVKIGKKKKKQFAFIYEGHLKITGLLFSEGFLVSLPWARRQLT